MNYTGQQIPEKVNHSPVPQASPDVGVPQSEETDMVRRNVVVIMPFGCKNNSQNGSKNHSERQCILYLMRIKHIIEKVVKVTPEGVASHSLNIKYDVNVFREPIGRVPEGAIDKVANADVLIALLTAGNVNVIYELAIRNLLKDEPILIVKGQSDDVLPVYLKDVAYISYDHADSAEVINQIEKIAGENFPTLNWKKPHQIPDALKQAIDAKDYLIEELQDALQKLEDNPQRPPHFLRKHVVDLDPGHVLYSWTTYAPFSVVRIRWQRKRFVTGYDETDMVDNAVVYAGNREYMRMFALNYREFPDADGENRLTLDALIRRMKRYMEPSFYKRWVTDQERLTKQIILEDGIGQAKVPIRFNDKHPVFANQVYLPILLGKRVVGSTRSPHSVFLAVAFSKKYELSETESPEIS